MDDSVGRGTGRTVGWVCDDDDDDDDDDDHVPNYDFF